MNRESIKGDELKKKAKEDEKEITDENEMEDEEKSCNSATKAVDITEDDLIKSVQKLEDFVEAADPISRKNELLEKAQIADLSDSEKDELFKALGCGVSEEAAEVDTVVKGLEENSEMQKSLDVSEFLNEQHSELVKALGSLEGKIDVSDSRQHEFNIILAKSVAMVGRLMKSLNGRMSTIEDQPMGKPRSTIQPLTKAFAGGRDQGETLSKAEVVEQLHSLNASGKVPSDIDMGLVMAKFEGSNILDAKIRPYLTLDRAVN